MSSSDRGRRRVVAGLGAALLAAGARPRPARAADAPITLKLATIAPEGTPWAEQVQQYKAQVEAATKGRLRIKPFLGGALGDENQTVAECRRGRHPHVGRHHRRAGHLGARDLGARAALPAARVRGRRPHPGPGAARGPAAAAGRRAGFVLVLWAENGFRSFGTKWGPGADARRPQGAQDALAGEPGAPRDLPRAGGPARSRSR